MANFSRHIDTISFLRSIANSGSPAKDEACHRVIVLQLCSLISNLVNGSYHTEAAVLAQSLLEATKHYSELAFVRESHGLTREDELMQTLLAQSLTAIQINDLSTMSPDVGEA